MVAIACLCPPTSTGQVRHPEGDTVDLRDTLDFRQALTVRNAVGLVYRDDPDATEAEVLAAMSETYVLVGVRSWSLVDAKGLRVPVNSRTIRALLLADYEAASAVSEAADEKYSDRVIRPLTERAPTTSPAMPTDESTSATNGPVPRSRRKPSKPSWTTTTPTDGIAPMSASPGGGSS